jgi:transposase
MMGRQAVSESLFYDFRLEDHVPGKHLLRSLDKVLRFDGIRAALSSYYSHTGRPSIDPELMLRMMLVGYAYGIRSERRLCEEVHLNLAYRWFCRLGLEGKVPDSSTFSKNRYGRFQESGIYRTFFEEVVRQCHVESGPLSSPIRATSRACAPIVSAMASGVEEHRPCQTVSPLLSITQRWVCMEMVLWNSS